MRDNVPSASYSSVCNVLRQCNISLIPTYRVYRLCDTDSMITFLIQKEPVSWSFVYMSYITEPEGPLVSYIFNSLSIAVAAILPLRVR